MKQKELTNSLRRLHRQLSSDMGRLKVAQTTLLEDREKLNKTAMNEITEKQVKAEALLKDIKRKQQLSQLLANLGFVIFIITIIYTILKRAPIIWYIRTQNEGQHEEL
eukprot:snap_masked-scaffold_5-processed-gene-16.42-mRNA-1 protein AED:1.00 eAED:1.00 QI:0/-1/0/0/-1/1/1/0/107